MQRTRNITETALAGKQLNLDFQVIEKPQYKPTSQKTIRVVKRNTDIDIVMSNNKRTSGT